MRRIALIWNGVKLTGIVVETASDVTVIASPTTSNPVHSFAVTIAGTVILKYKDIYL